jgi:hypothetical protein
VEGGVLILALHSVWDWAPSYATEERSASLNRSHRRWKQEALPNHL